MKAAFFILALLVISANSEFLKKQSDSLALAQLDKHHFGSSVLSTIQVHLATSSPIEEIQDLLSEIEEQLTADQAQDDDFIAGYRAQCFIDENNYGNQIQFHQLAWDTAAGIKSANEDLLSTAQGELASTEEFLANNQQYLADGTATRDQQFATWSENVIEHNDAISALNDAEALVEHLKTGTSFVQLKSGFKKVTEKLEAHKHKNTLYTPLIAVLAQLAVKADPAAVDRILDLIRKIRSGIQDSLAFDNNQEAEQEAAWSERSTFLSQMISESKDKIASLSANIDQYETTIAEESLKVAFHSSEFQRNTDELAAREQDCADHDSQYQSNSDERSRELDILDRLTTHFNEKLASMESYLSDRVDVEEFSA